MISKATRAKYTATIGIECHVQLKTKTKLFAGVDNNARNAAPNTLISHICLGLPGALPVLNEKAIELAIRAAFALRSKPQLVSKFDRKHYFYPDLPMGYQITQLYEPIVLGGSVDISIDGSEKKIGITRAHLEADAGKNTHPTGADYSLVDLNRAGTPLLEVVSEPDMHTPAEARAYVQELYLLMKYADVSDADLFHGNMRFDVNVSVSTGNELGIRTETKNLNSFKSVEKAAEYEITRQIELIEKGQTIDQETRGWDDAKQKTVSQRGKEQAHDYRYMPDPDLPPVVLEPKYVSNIEKTMPIMPDEWRRRLQKLGLDISQTDILLAAEVESADIVYLDLVEEFLPTQNIAKQLTNWLVNIEIPLRSEGTIHISLPAQKRAEMYAAIAELVDDNKLSSTNTRLLIVELLQHETLPESIEKYATEQGFIQVSDVNELEKIVRTVLEDNSAAVAELNAGEQKVLGFLVGQVMKASLGKANPQIARQLIQQILNA